MKTAKMFLLFVFCALGSALAQSIPASAVQLGAQVSVPKPEEKKTGGGPLQPAQVMAQAPSNTTQVMIGEGSNPKAFISHLSWRPRDLLKTDLDSSFDDQSALAMVRPTMPLVYAVFETEDGAVFTNDACGEIILMTSVVKECQVVGRAVEMVLVDLNERSVGKYLRYAGRVITGTKLDPYMRKYAQEKILPVLNTKLQRTAVQNAEALQQLRDAEARGVSKATRDWTKEIEGNRGVIQMPSPGKKK